MDILHDITTGKNTTFCPMPWVGFSAEADGKFRICCMDNQSRNTGEL